MNKNNDTYHEIFCSIQNMSNDEVNSLLTEKDKKKISKDIQIEKEKFSRGELFPDIKLSDEDTELLFKALGEAFKRARLFNKARFTPKKYRKE